MQPNSHVTLLLSRWFLLLLSREKRFFLHCQLLLQSTACTQQLTTPTFCTNTWSSCIFVPEQANSNPASPARTAHLSRPRQLISFANLLCTLHEPLHGQLPASSPGQARCGPLHARLSTYVRLLGLTQQPSPTP